MEVKPSGFKAALTLFFLAPMIGELLSGSSPPAEFFNPFSLVIISALYGSGAILVRELCVRWGKGWQSILLLGAAYGILEEGLMVKSFFDPNWIDIGILGTYGRWAGVNWVWSLELIIYHAVVSIAIPILLVENLFPKQRGQPWLNRRGLIGLAILLISDVIFGFLVLTPYRPPLIPYLLALLGAVLLYNTAKNLIDNETQSPEIQPGKEIHPVNFFLLGFGATFAFFLINWGLPSTGIPVMITLAANLLLVIAVLRQARKMMHRIKFGNQGLLALASGTLGFFILLAPLQELDATRMDNTSGMAIVGLVMLIFLILIWRQLKRSHQGQAGSAAD